MCFFARHQSCDTPQMSVIWGVWFRQLTVVLQLCFPHNHITVYDVITEMGMRRLQTLIQSLLLRRTKQDIGSDGQPLVKKDHVNWC